MRSRHKSLGAILAGAIGVPAAAVATFLVCPAMIEDLTIDRVRIGQIPMLERTLAAFRADYGRLPTEQEGLSVLLNPPGRESEPYFRKRKLPVDPWGGSYIYRPAGDGEHFALYSPGRNGVDENGGGDDVVNWPKTYTCEEYGVGCRRPCDVAQASALIGLVIWLVVGGVWVTLLCVKWARRRIAHAPA